MAEPTACAIYGLFDPRDEPTFPNVRYIGKSVNATLRLRKHIEHARRGDDTRKSRWIRSLLALDLRPSTVILVQTTEADAGRVEQAWIERAVAEGCRLTNTAQGGTGGRTLTDEARAARSNAMRSRWEDPVYRERMAAAHRGKRHDEHARALVSAAATRQWAADPDRKARQITARLGKPGRPMTDELRAKISKGLTGKPWSEARRRAHEDRRQTRA